MSASSALEIYFSVDPAKRAFRRPLFFHHTPKTAGTSFRFAVSHFLTEHRLGRLVAPNIRANLKATGLWPDGLGHLYRSVAIRDRVEAMMSHYTALIANEIDAPILSLVRDPDDHLLSFIAFHADSMNRKFVATGSAEQIFRDPKVSNAQMRSLCGPDVSIPIERPESDADTTRWSELVEEIVERFTLFRMADYGRLLDHCRRHYGAHLIEVREKARSRDPSSEALLAAVRPLLRSRDPMWLDRLLYQRLASDAGALEPAAK